ncbi:MAG TPA: GGDEF domain-containing protein [Gammaproteobacteria bacterium]|nr:GGDEF domain-containing protein [Gammaproteobacteria bacterium]
MPPVTNRKPAAELLRLALPLLLQYGIPPTPRNYAVWYEYVAESNQPLRQAIDEIIGQGGEFNDDINADLYQTYLASDKEKEIENLRSELQRLINESSTEISGATDEASRYQTRLEGHAQRLVRGLDSEKVLHIIDALNEETSAMVETNGQLQQKLNAMAQELVSLRKELEWVHEELLIDALTGLLNRKGFDQMLEDAMGEAQDNQSHLCLMMVDVDHFKRINDKFGHVVGDEVLRFIAGKMREAVKGRDIVARYGGEEFSIILPNTPLTGAMHIAEELRQTISSSRLTRKRKNEHQVLDQITVSIGVAWYRRGEDMNDFIHRADRALYHAKRAGRNRVVDGETI